MTRETNDGGQAFPQLNSTGMTLRDWFAGQVIASGWNPRSTENYQTTAKSVYAMADAMIEARKG